MTSISTTSVTITIVTKKNVTTIGVTMTVLITTNVAAIVVKIIGVMEIVVKIKSAIAVVKISEGSYCQKFTTTIRKKNVYINEENNFKCQQVNF